MNTCSESPNYNGPNPNFYSSFFFWFGTTKSKELKPQFNRHERCGPMDAVVSHQSLSYIFLFFGFLFFFSILPGSRLRNFVAFRHDWHRFLLSNPFSLERETCFYIGFEGEVNIRPNETLSFLILPLYKYIKRITLKMLLVYDNKSCK